MFTTKTKMTALLIILASIALYSNGLTPVKALIPQEVRQLGASNPWSMVTTMFDKQTENLKGGR